MKSTEEFWDKKSFVSSEKSDVDEWLLSRRKDSEYPICWILCSLMLPKLMFHAAGG